MEKLKGGKKTLFFCFCQFLKSKVIGFVEFKVEMGEAFGW